jgi:hypothetical protein
MLSSELKCVGGNIVRSSKVYCLISAFSWFVIIIVHHFSGAIFNCGCGIAGGCFTDVLLHSSINYLQEHALPTATEPIRLHKDVPAGCGALTQRFHRVFKPNKVLICDLEPVVRRKSQNSFSRV